MLNIRVNDGCVMTRLVGRGCTTVEAKNCSQPSLCGVHCGHSGTGTDSVPCAVAVSCRRHSSSIP